MAFGLRHLCHLCHLCHRHCVSNPLHPAQSAPSQLTRHDGDALQYHVPYAPVRAVRQLRRFFGTATWEAQEAQAIPAAKLLNDWDANGPGISHFLTSNQQHSACLCDMIFWYTWCERIKMLLIHFMWIPIWFFMFIVKILEFSWVLELGQTWPNYKQPVKCKCHRFFQGVMQYLSNHLIICLETSSLL